MTQGLSYFSFCACYSAVLTLVSLSLLGSLLSWFPRIQLYICLFMKPALFILLSVVRVNLFPFTFKLLDLLQSPSFSLPSSVGPHTSLPETNYVVSMFLKDNQKTNISHIAILLVDRISVLILAIYTTEVFFFQRNE